MSYKTLIFVVLSTLSFAVTAAPQHQHHGGGGGHSISHSSGHTFSHGSVSRSAPSQHFSRGNPRSHIGPSSRVFSHQRAQQPHVFRHEDRYARRHDKDWYRHDGYRHHHGNRHNGDYWYRHDGYRHHHDGYRYYRGGYAPYYYYYGAPGYYYYNNGAYPYCYNYGYDDYGNLVCYDDDDNGEALLDFFLGIMSNY